LDKAIKISLFIVQSLNRYWMKQNQTSKGLDGNVLKLKILLQLKLSKL